MTSWSCIKTTWLKRSGQFWNLWRHNLVKKELQYTYYPISQEVKATRQFVLKKHTQNMWEKLFSERYLKYQNWAFLWISSVKFLTGCFYCMLIWVLSKYTEIKLQATCFYLIQSFLKNQNSFPASFSAWFLKKNSYLRIFY